MSEQSQSGSDDVEAPEAGEPTEPAADAAPAPDWWHREHPVFVPLVGYFAGVLFFLIGPGLYTAALHWMADDQTAESLFPFVLLFLVVPIALMVPPRTRRLGRYWLLGILSTAVVVVGVGAAVLWFMYRQG